jgi:hypothetical protein
MTRLANLAVIVVCAYVVIWVVANYVGILMHQMDGMP